MALAASHFPELPNGLLQRVTLHQPDANVAAAVFADVAANLSVQAGFPDEIVEVENAFLGSSFEVGALYDETGRRIDHTAVPRLDIGFAFAPDRIEPPAEYVTYEQPVLFLNRYFRHWGHALTEGSSRLWARHRHPELARLPAVFAGLFELHPREDGVDGLLNALGQYGALQFYDGPGAGAPIKLKKAFVPAPSFRLDAKAYRGHLTALRALAEGVLGGRPAPPDSRPVYFSRSRLATSWRPGFEDELALEAALAERGFLILHPETMTFRQQVECVNAHSVFVGLNGSAMHNILFALHGEEKVAHILIAENWGVNRNQILIEALVGAQSHHVGVCRHIATNPDRFQIDVPATLDYLRAQGLIGIA